MAARNGDQYRKGLDDGRVVWLGDREVNVLQEPLFESSVNGVAGYYDWQHQFKDECLVTDPESGELIPVSLLIPRSKEHLELRSKCFDRIARYSYGMMGRTPDYVNVTLAGYVGRSDVLSSKGDPEPGKRIKNFYKEVVAGDLAMTHTIIQASIDRSVDDYSGLNAEIGARVVRRTENGLIIRGAKVLATLGPFADELFVYPSGPLPAHADPSYALMFSVPLNTKGIVQICRDHYGRQVNVADAPFSARFDEQDCIVIFDDVEVPYERVFIDGDVAAYNSLIRSGWHANISQQTNLRAAVKFEFAYELGCRMAEVLNSARRPEIAMMLGEILSYARMTRGAVDSGMYGAREWGNGTWFMDDQATRASRALVPEWMVRTNEILIAIGSHNLLATPSLSAFENPKMRSMLETYVPGANGISAQERAKIFRMAWDFVGSSLGNRNELYERFYLGSKFRALSVDHMVKYAQRGDAAKQPVGELLARAASK